MSESEENLGMNPTGSSEQQIVSTNGSGDIIEVSTIPMLLEPQINDSTRKLMDLLNEWELQDALPDLLCNN